MPGACGEAQRVKKEVTKTEASTLQAAKEAFLAEQKFYKNAPKLVFQELTSLKGKEALKPLKLKASEIKRTERTKNALKEMYEREQMIKQAANALSRTRLRKVGVKGSALRKKEQQQPQSEEGLRAVRQALARRDTLTAIGVRGAAQGLPGKAPGLGLSPSPQTRDLSLDNAKEAYLMERPLMI